MASSPIQMKGEKILSYQNCKAHRGHGADIVSYPAPSTQQARRGLSTRLCQGAGHETRADDVRSGCIGMRQ